MFALFPLKGKTITKRQFLNKKGKAWFPSQKKKKKKILILSTWTFEILLFQITGFASASNTPEEGYKSRRAHLPFCIIPSLTNSSFLFCYTFRPWARGEWPLRCVFLQQVSQSEARWRGLDSFINRMRPVGGTLQQTSPIGAFRKKTRTPRWRRLTDRFGCIIALIALPHTIIKVVATICGWQPALVGWSVSLGAGFLSASKRAQDSPRGAHIPIAGKEVVSGPRPRCFWSSKCVLLSLQTTRSTWTSLTVEAFCVFLVAKHIQRDLFHLLGFFVFQFCHVFILFLCLEWFLMTILVRTGALLRCFYRWISPGRALRGWPFDWGQCILSASGQTFRDCRQKVVQGRLQAWRLTVGSWCCGSAFGCYTHALLPLVPPLCFLSLSVFLKQWREGIFRKIQLSSLMQRVQEHNFACQGNSKVSTLNPQV